MKAIVFAALASALFPHLSSAQDHFPAGYREERSAAESRAAMKKGQLLAAAEEAADLIFSREFGINVFCQTDIGKSGSSFDVDEEMQFCKRKIAKFQASRDPGAAFGARVWRERLQLIEKYLRDLATATTACRQNTYGYGQQWREEARAFFDVWHFDLAKLKDELRKQRAYADGLQPGPERDAAVKAYNRQLREARQAERERSQEFERLQNETFARQLAFDERCRRRVIGYKGKFITSFVMTRFTF